MWDILQKASGKKFQDLLEEAFVQPIGLAGEFYIGVPAGSCGTFMQVMWISFK